MFTPITTQRLVIRAFTPDDVDDLHARRDDPEVARYQNWVTPYPRSEAEQMVHDVAAMDGPTDEEWWMAVVADRETGEAYGDLVVHLTDRARIAEIGYSFGSAHWGHGYAVESLDAFVTYLFEDLGVTRVFGTLHPDNSASAMVMERCGFVFEGHTRSSFWLDDEVSDDWIYGTTRDLWDEWRNRSAVAPEEVALVEITPETADTVLGLVTHKSQERFVSPMGGSFADAMFPEVYNGAPVVPWMRAITADDEIVGFVMVAESTDHHPEPYLWRLLIDRLHQRRGIGDRALRLVEEAFMARGDSAMTVSWSDGKGSPRPFYERNGYVPTGEIEDGEVVARKQLRATGGA
ncbi:MAG TPA: GNAT family N-acetyltransferase [Acidimicrobiia bacterium]|nr:GNAT family N-acetyltransferase [Acidimicrobiia bacterium]